MSEKGGPAEGDELNTFKSGKRALMEGNAGNTSKSGEPPYALRIAMLELH